jgi:hypothetical protein
LRTIAATTWSEYKQYFERDAALERRFQMDGWVTLRFNHQRHQPETTLSAIRTTNKP